MESRLRIAGFQFTSKEKATVTAWVPHHAPGSAPRVARGSRRRKGLGTLQLADGPSWTAAADGSRPTICRSTFSCRTSSIWLSTSSARRPRCTAMRSKCSHAREPLSREGSGGPCDRHSSGTLAETEASQLEQAHVLLCLGLDFSAAASWTGRSKRSPKCSASILRIQCPGDLEKLHATSTSARGL